MKKILLSVSMIAVIAIAVMGATGAFFSDTETSTGNTFTAGAIDLKIDSTATYNGQAVAAATWAEKDLVPTADKFFNFSDIKPGDKGENTISLHVINNDAYACATVSNLTDYENGQTEPESLVDTTTGTNQGELSQTMNWKVWKDDGTGSGTACDNIQNGTEPTLTSGHPTNGTLALYDSVTNNGAVLAGGSTSCLGVSWELPAASGNETQTDSMTGDISFNVVQSRNNTNFTCSGASFPEVRTINLENKNINWQIVPGDQISGVMTYSSNDSTFHGTVTAQGLEANKYYQITLNGPGTCTSTDNNLAAITSDLFQRGFYNGGSGLSATCGNPGEGIYNMNLIGDHYTVQANGSGNINYPFSLTLPVGSYSGVKVLVKKMLDTHVSPWVDTSTEHTTNLFETAAINFTVN